jgi:hypothetical protein
MGLVRPHLLEWQWSDYSAKHQDRTNLLLHIIAVPLFELAVIALVVGLVPRAGYRPRRDGGGGRDPGTWSPARARNPDAVRGADRLRVSAACAAGVALGS